MLGSDAVYGRTPSGYVQNIAETRAWARAVEVGNPPVAKGHALSAVDKLRAHVIEHLMCCGEIDTAQADHAFAFGGDWCRHELQHLQTLADDGLIQIDSPVVRLTDRSRPLARLAASVFDGYRQHANLRHLVAV